MLRLRTISKHPMLLFNCLSFLLSPVHSVISKHPMLLFNIDEATLVDKNPIISKHPMLLFNMLSEEKNSFLTYFKTSYVTV